MLVLGVALVGLAIGLIVASLWGGRSDEDGPPALASAREWILASSLPGRRAVVACLVGLAVACLTRLPLAGLSAGVLVLGLLTHRDTRTRKQREVVLREQLPAALAAIAGGLQTGYPIEQALAMAADALMPPLGDELRYTCRELELGVPLEQALHGLQDRVGIEELDMAVCGLLMHEELGSDLADFFRSAANLCSEREAVRQELHTSLAGPRVSILSLLAIPWVFVFAVDGVTRLLTQDTESYIHVLFVAPAGKSLLAFAVLLQLGGVLISRKVMDLEV